MQVLQSFKGHKCVCFDVGRSQDNIVIFDDLFKVCINKLEDKWNIWPMTKHIKKSNNVGVVQLLE